MDELLQTLLNRLESIGEDHEELYDTEVRQQMGNAIRDGFVRPRAGFMVPEQFGMLSDEANNKVRNAIIDYISQAKEKAAELGITRFHDRLAAFQNPDVQASLPGSTYEEFFGHVRPEFYDEHGNAIHTR